VAAAGKLGLMFSIKKIGTTFLFKSLFVVFLIFELAEKHSGSRPALLALKHDETGEKRGRGS
jgi:hypothetical protein